MGKANDIIVQVQRLGISNSDRELCQKWSPFEQDSQGKFVPIKIEDLKFVICEQPIEILDQEYMEHTTRKKTLRDQMSVHMNQHS